MISWGVQLIGLAGALIDPTLYKVRKTAGLIWRSEGMAAQLTCRLCRGMSLPDSPCGALWVALLVHPCPYTVFWCFWSCVALWLVLLTACLMVRFLCLAKCL